MNRFALMCVEPIGFIPFLGGILTGRHSNRVREITASVWEWIPTNFLK